MKTTGLNFIEAVQAAKAGKRIRRASWALNCAVADVNNYFYYIGQNDSFFICIVDILADDWEIVPEPPKTMTFMEAWAAMKEGKKVKRFEMPWIYRIDENEVFAQDCYTSDWGRAGLYFIDIEATEMSEAKIVYITKYWQTRGILMMDSVEPRIMDGGIRVHMDSNDYYHNTTTLFFGSDWWSNRENAIDYVEKCCEKRIKSLEKQLEKLRNLVLADTLVDCRRTDNKGGKEA